MASLLMSYGASVSASAESFRQALQQTVSPLDESKVAEVIVSVLPRDETQTPWNLDVVAEVLSQESRQCNWALVAQRLDQPNLVIRNEADFRLLIKFFQRVSNQLFPGSGLMGVWNNRPAQLVLLLFASNAMLRGLVDFSGLVRADQTLPDVPVPQNVAWCCLPFYNTLLELAGRGHYNEVVQTMLEASEAYPEYVTVLLAQAQDPNSNARAEVLRRSLPKFTGLAGSRNTSIVVMRRLQVVNPDLLVLLFRMAFKRSVTVQDIIERHSILQSTGATIFRRLEEEGLPDELLGFWCVQADRTSLNLEEKIRAVLEANPQMARSFLQFLKQHVGSLRAREQEGGLLSFENFGVLIRALQHFPAIVPIDELRVLGHLFQQYQQHGSALGINQALLGGASAGGAAGGASGAGVASAGGQGSLNLPLGGAAAAEDTAAAAAAGPLDDVESESNSNYQRVYKGEMTVPELMQLLKRFKLSSELREQEIFRYMIHNMFDEVRFFHKYPDKELQLTSQIFGGLVAHHLVSSITLGIALRYVVEALLKDPEKGGANDKMFRFGKMTLEQFKGRLGEWPQYCGHIMTIPHFERLCPQLWAEAQRAMNNPAPPTTNIAKANALAGNAAAVGLIEVLATGNVIAGGAGGASAGGGGGGAVPTGTLSQQMASMALLSADRTSSLDAYSAAGGATPTFSALSLPSVASLPSVPQQQPTAAEIEAQRSASPRNNKPSAIDEMVKVNVEAVNPPMPIETTLNQIHFIINNIAANNVEAKVPKLRELLLPEYFVWFANYLVTKRISQQPNLHPLYLSVLETFDSAQLFKDILDSTYYNVTKLLQSPNITSSSSERSLLRNLGIWLGQVTLGRNKPILQRRINLKELLFWGYETGRLIAVCSFVAKTVEGVRDSKVFRPPNPWLMALLGVMRDLYEVEELKMNIKFEVQVLCKNVNIRIEDVPRANLLGQLRMPNKDKNPDFTVKTSAPTLSSGVSYPSLGVGKSDEELKAGGSSDQPVIPNLSSYVVVNAGILLFTQNPAARKIVPLAVDRAIREVIQPVVDRSAQVACVSTKQVVLKDFAQESNEQLLRTAAHLMVSQLAGNLSIVTSKEPLRVSMASNLRALLQQANVTDSQVVEQIVQVCSGDNLDLGCALIEKAAMEKAIRDIDDQLQVAYQARRKARDAGQPFTDPVVARAAGAKFPRELPDALKTRPTGLLPHQLQVYEGFTRQRMQASIAAASAAAAAAAGAGDGGAGGGAVSGGGGGAGDNKLGAVMLGAPHALEAYQIILQRIEVALKTIQLQAQGREVSISMLPGDHEILSLLRDMIIVTQRTQIGVRIEAAMSFAEIIFKRMVENVSVPDLLRLEVLVGSLEALRDACGDKKKFAPDMVAWLNRYAGTFNVNDETCRKIHRAILLLLMRAKLIRTQEIDAYLSAQMDGGRNMVWVELALSFVRTCLADGVAATQEFSSSFDTVSKMRPANAAVRKQLQKWLTDLRALAATKDEQKAAAAAASGAGHAGGGAVGAGAGGVGGQNATVREHVSVLLDRWLRVSQTAMNDQIFAQYLHLMHQFGVLKTEEAADRFFRVATELCAEACLKSAQPPAATDASGAPSMLNFTVIDALSKLFLLLVRLADKESGDMSARVNLLSRVLNAVVRTLVEDHEAKKTRREQFDQRPYYRLLSNLSQDLGLPDASQEPSPAVIPLLVTYSQAYSMLVPTAVPGFAFSWLQLISHRYFMPQLLLIKGQKGWPYMHRLLMALLLFLQPFLKTVQLTEAVRKLYKGTLRVLLVVLHDFPEFLAEYHLSFCDVIPHTCVQLRNLVLSAFPKTMRLPDPFTPNLKIDMIPEINQAPRISSDSLGVLAAIRQRLDLFLQTRQPVEFPSLLPQVLLQNGQYNMQLLNTLVVYLGANGVSQLQSSSPVPIENTGSMDIFKHLTAALDSEGRYHLMSAMANQLRYPNSHTRYFSMLVLLLFAEAEHEFLQEQITRVLLERLIVHRPHPVRCLFLCPFFHCDLSLLACACRLATGCDANPCPSPSPPPPLLRFHSGAC